MKMFEPFIITPRLLCGLKVGKSFLSIEFAGTTSEGRTRYRYHIDTPDFDYTGADLKSGCGGGSLQSGMESLLSFLTACAESRRYSRHTGHAGENTDLFPENVGQWAEAHADELSLLELELSEAENLIIH